MNYKIIVKFDDDVQEVYETDDIRLFWKFIYRWSRKAVDYVGVTVTVESRTK
jgi:hypothetical protein